MIICKLDNFYISEENLSGESVPDGDFHSHNYVELIFMLSGECELFIREKMLYRLHRNTMLIIPNGVKHKLIPASLRCKTMLIALPLNYVNIFLASEFGDSLYNRAIKLSSEELRFVKNIYSKIHDECLQGDKYSEEMLKSCILEFFVFFQRSAKQDEKYVKEITVIDQITAYLYEHFHEDINLKSVSQQFFVSRTYLSRLFKVKTGRGFNEYLNKIRIEQAKIKLKTTTLPITEIAYSCGFNDSNYFSKYFKQSEGMPPHVFRKGGREEPEDNK